MKKLYASAVVFMCFAMTSNAAEAGWGWLRAAVNYMGRGTFDVM